MRAALEGVCQQLALVLASMRDAGNEVREVRATGGFARSALWRQMLADALGMPIGFAAGHEGSAFGAALLGMEALGLVEGIDARGASSWASRTSSSPTPPRRRSTPTCGPPSRRCTTRSCRPSARWRATAEPYARRPRRVPSPERGVLGAGAAIDAGAGGGWTG